MACAKTVLAVRIRFPTEICPKPFESSAPLPTTRLPLGQDAAALRETPGPNSETAVTIS
jgi:hypothetical protein